MNTHDIETTLRSYLTSDGYIAADEIRDLRALLAKYGTSEHSPTPPNISSEHSDGLTEWERRADLEAEQARVALLDKPVIPEGYALVPIEPTGGMLRAAYNAIESEGIVTTPWVRETIYKTMLEAAPKPWDKP